MIDNEITFRIIGLPAPQGSKTRMPNGAMVEASSASGRAKLVDWRHAIATEAFKVQQEYGTITWPHVELEVVFHFPMPKGRSAAVKARGSAWKASKPDLDKLVRALGDGLVRGGLLPDDNRFVAITAWKIEVHERWTGASVVLKNADRTQRIDP